MQDITLTDQYSSLTIRMCEKHYRSYRDQLRMAIAGGTSFKAEKTTKRGCELCKKTKKSKRSTNGN